MAYNNSFAQQNPARPQLGTAIVSLHSDTVKYVEGTPIRISGQVFNQTGVITSPIPVIITIMKIQDFVPPASQIDLPRPIQESTVAVLTNKTNGSYNVLLTPISSPGIYTINASLPSDLPGTHHSSSLSIEIEDLVYTRTFIVLYVGVVVGTLGLTFVILKAPRPSNISAPKHYTGANEDSTFYRIRQAIFTNLPLSENTYQVSRFIFLSSIAITLILSLALTDVQIAPLSPLGLVIKTITNTEPLP